MSQRALFRLRGARLEKLLHRAHDDDDDADGDADDDDYHEQRQGPPIHPALFDRTVNHEDQKCGADPTLLKYCISQTQLKLKPSSTFVFRFFSA